MPDRYSRQTRFAPLGDAGQHRLAAARVALIGCGALGTHLADALARAGVGFLRILDRDTVEPSNLQRQILFDEADAAAGAPKAVAAANRLASINSEITVEPVLADVRPDNIESFVTDCALILDATDNFEIRFLINDVAVKHRLPWIYGACVGATGMVLPIVPGQTPCLRCLWNEPPPPGISPTCDTAGILAPAAAVTAALQAAEALKLLSGNATAVSRRLVQFDLWANTFDAFDWQAAPDCPCCVHGRFDHLNSTAGRTAALCGRNAVQIAATPGATVDFARVAEQVRPAAKNPPTFNRYLLRFTVDRFAVTLFSDGRAIIHGTDSPEEARTVYARYIGA